MLNRCSIFVFSELRRVGSKQSGNTPFGVAGCSCEAQPRQVVRIKGGDVVLLCRRHKFLRLDNLDGIRDARSKPVTCLTQCVLSENTITFSNHDLLVGCIEPKKCVSNLEVDTPAYVFVLSAPLREDSVCLRDVCLNSPAAPDRKIKCSENREHSIGLSGIHAGHKVAAVHFDCRSFLGLRRLSSLRSCPNLRLGSLEVGPVRERFLERLAERSDRRGTVFHRRRKCEVRSEERRVGKECRSR